MNEPIKAKRGAPYGRRSAPIGFIDKETAAKVLGVARRTIDNLMKCNLIPYYKFRRSVFFKQTELLEAVDASRVPSKAETSKQ